MVDGKRQSGENPLGLGFESFLEKDYALFLVMQMFWQVLC